VEQLVDRLKEFWKGLGTVQKAVVLGIPALLIIGGIAAIVTVVSAPPEKVPLFTNLEPMDASRIVDELKKSDVEYELANDGRDISVPVDDVYDLRLQMVGMGLPQHNVGFELFDKRELGITESETQVKKQRAMQGALAKTLEALEPVDSASVLLNIAPESSFLDTDNHSTASVTLHLKPSQKLSPNQVKGIQLLVARSVPRLSEDDVAVLDGSGNPLKGEEDTPETQMIASMELTDLQHKFRSRVERDLEAKILKVLEGPYGAGAVSPSVTVEIDFTKMHRESERYEPVVDNQGIEQRVEEHRSRSNKSEEDLGGVPGTTSNIPGYLGINAGNGQSKEDSTYDLMVDYLVTKEVTLEDLPPGAITKRSAAVAISTDTYDANSKAAVETLVASAIGADPDAGDKVDVQAFQFKDTSAAAVSMQYAKQENSRMMSKVISWVVAVLMVAMVMFMLRSIITQMFPREELKLAPEAAGVEGELMTREEAEEYALAKLDELSSTHQDKMRREIERLIDNNPERVTNLLRSWLLEDK
jgi:flagellar M-ring protein FliF